MDAIRYIEITQRICRNNDCRHCPLWPNDHRGFIDCKQFIREYPEEAIRIIEKWEKEHSDENRANKLLELFPKTIIDSKGRPDLCPQCFGESCKADSITIDSTVCNKCKDEFWYEEVEEW